MSVSVVEAGANSRPNILLITADDMNYDSPGCMGSPLAGITPNLDRLAADGILFRRCYNTSTICGPSRASLLSGMYPQSNGNMGHGRQPPGFWEKTHPGFEPSSVTTLLRDAGYFTALLDKSATRTCRWDYKRNHWQTHAGRDPKMFHQYTKEAIEKAGATGRPFFINANPTDPHRYWAGHPHETKQWVDEQMQGREYSPLPNGKPYPDPDHTYAVETVPMPPCFPDTPELRASIKHYYDSVKRLDMTIGAILKALDDSGKAGNTMVVFISDHGMGWAFAKWSLYPYGTRTPCIVRYPGSIPGGRVDDEHVLSTVDIAPTFLELAGVKPQPATDGFSFWSLATGSDASWQRQEAFSCFNFMNLVSDVVRRRKPGPPNCLTVSITIGLCAVWPVADSSTYGTHGPTAGTRCPGKWETATRSSTSWTRVRSGRPTGIGRGSTRSVCPRSSMTRKRTRGAGAI